MSGTMTISEPPWATPWYIGRVSYVELEAKLAQTAQTERETQPVAERGGPKPTDVA
jgi:hypothetical protein